MSFVHPCFSERPSTHAAGGDVAPTGEACPAPAWRRSSSAAGPAPCMPVADFARSTNRARRAARERQHASTMESQGDRTPDLRRPVRIGRQCVEALRHPRRRFGGGKSSRYDASSLIPTASSHMRTPAWAYFRTRTASDKVGQLPLGLHRDMNGWMSSVTAFAGNELVHNRWRSSAHENELRLAVPSCRMMIEQTPICN